MGACTVVVTGASGSVYGMRLIEQLVLAGHEVSVVLRRFEPETDSLNVYLELHDAVGTVWIDETRLTPLSLLETKKVRGE